MVMQWSPEYELDSSATKAAPPESMGDRDECFVVCL